MRKERKAYFIRVQGQAVEVSREVYIEFYRLRRYEKHLEEVDRENGKVVFSSLESEDHLTEDWLAELADDMAILFERQNFLRDCLSRLKEKERWLIEQLVLLDRFESEVALELGVSQPAVNRQKRRAISSLRKIYFENL